MGLSNELSSEAGSFSTAASTATGVFSQRSEALFPQAGALGCAVCFDPLLFLPVYLFANVGPQGLPATTLWGLPAAAWPALFHNPPPCWVHQLPPCCESSLPCLPIPAPPTGLDGCFFFISLVVGLPYSSIFCQFWLFFVFKLLSSFWLCEEAQCVYLHLHLGQKSLIFFFKREGKGRRKRGREISVCGCLSHAPYRGLAHNPGICPDWELNW